MGQRAGSLRGRRTGDVCVGNPVKHRLNHLRRRLSELALQCLLYLNRFLARLGFRHLYYAEFFTDWHIRRHFFPDFQYRGVLVEVGCATPELLSMAQHFRHNGWRCIGIEPNPRFVDLHRRAGNEVYAYAAADYEADHVDFVVIESSQAYSSSSLTAHSYSALAIKDNYRDYQGQAVNELAQSTIQVKVRKLSSILREHCPEVKRVDLLSVDVEGFELEVIRGMDLEEYQVQVVVLENLFHEPAYQQLMESLGYQLHSKVHYNYIFTRRPKEAG